MSNAFTEAAGRRVVASDTAEEVGEVKTFVLDQSGRKITQLQIAGRKRKPELVDWQNVTSFGTDAVMISSIQDVHEAPDERTTDMVKGNIEYVGARILTTDGAELGSVSDVHFDDAAGDILAVMSDGAGRIDAALIRGLGSYAVVVSPPA